MGSYKAGMVVWGLPVEKLEGSLNFLRVRGVVRSVKIFETGRPKQLIPEFICQGSRLRLGTDGSPLQRECQAGYPTTVEMYLGLMSERWTQLDAGGGGGGVLERSSLSARVPLVFILKPG